MNIGYIKQREVPTRFIDKVKYFLGLVSICQYDQGYVFKVPLFEKQRKMERILKRVNKQIHQLKIDKVVFSEKIKNHFLGNLLKEMIIGKQEILNGKKLMEAMSYEILEYIFKFHKTDMRQENVFFLIKKDNSLDVQFLSRFVENCKTVNIVTNDMERFGKIQENLQAKEDILISVSNNKNKSLKRAKYILNVNMTEKDIQKFKIARDAILIHLRENVKYDKQAFNGINVNYFQIGMPDEIVEQFEPMGDVEEFDMAELYESLLLRKVQIAKRKITMLSKEELTKHKNITQEMITKDHIVVTGLIGNNGRICEKEIIQNKQNII